MLRRPPSPRPARLPLLLLALLLLAAPPPPPAHAQPPPPPPPPAPAPAPVLKLAFAKFATPPGWTRYVPSALSPGATLGYVASAPAVPPSLKSHVKRAASFSYRASPLPPGVYAVTFGLAQSDPCVPGKRVFTLAANAVVTDKIDLFVVAGCAVPYYVQVRGVVVADDGEMLVEAVSHAKYAPILSNFVVVPDDPGPTTTAPPTTTTTTTTTALTTLTTTATTATTAPPPPPPPTLPKSAKVAFPKYDTPAAYTRYDPSRLSPLPPGAKPVVVASGPKLDGDAMQPYRGHAKSKSGFVYAQPLAPGIYDVRLGFLEHSAKACKVAKRNFLVDVNGKTTQPIDVFDAVGCRQKLDVWVYGVTVADDGLLAISLSRVANKGFAPFLANFEAKQDNDSGTGGGDGDDQGDNDSDNPPPPKDVDIKLNLGSASDKPIPGTFKTFFTGKTTSTGEASPYTYKSARYGSDFSLSFDLPPGAYDVTLGFVENYGPVHCSGPNMRIFNVYINGQMQLSGFDIFAKVGCHVGVERLFPTQAVGSVDTKPLVVRFVAVKNFAQVAYIRVKTAALRCIPASSGGSLSDDHAAHAVPGSYPPQLGPKSPTSYVDSNGDGFANVFIDGSGSHTHFFDSANNIIGKVTDYSWTLAETGEVISTTKAFNYKFPLGTTRLKLAVLDNSCTRDEAETTVTVTGKIQPGQYCYYYQGLSQVPVGGQLFGDIKPSFAEVSKSVNLGFPSFAFDNTMFAVRCQFFLQVDQAAVASEISVHTAGSGDAVIYKGEDLIWDSTSPAKAEVPLAVGLTAFEVVYLRKTTQTPTLQFLVDGAIPSDSLISHDRTTVLPILSAASPHEGKKSGGTKVKITGYGLFDPLTVTFGGKQVSILQQNRKSTQFFVISPSSSSSAAVPIIATSSAGYSSNAVNFAYGSSCDNVDFIKTSLKNQDKDVDLELPTSVVLGHDGRLYMGTLGATVQVVAYHAEDLKVQSHCYSKPIKDPRFTKNGKPATRDILGITIDPRDVVIRPYVSTSTLYWLDKKALDNPISSAWRNGAVDRLKPGKLSSDAGVCLVYDKAIVRNLPVSNHDHAVNALQFTQGGDLLIAVGGNTNLGLPGWKLGGTWETRLSAAVLVAKLSKPDFNGEIKYTNENVLRKAVVSSGDISVFATGLRNAFGMGMTRKGDIYAVDQGPNCGFGNTATTCSDYNENQAAGWNPDAENDWPGKVKHGWKSCPYGIGRPDKLVFLQEGKFYGHPNVQRGGGECAWVDPNSGKTANNKSPPSNYVMQMKLLKSSVTGVGEYGANHFCGKLRGDLLLSTYKGGPTHRVGVSGGTVTSGPDTLVNGGGIAFVENAHGDLIFPKLTAKSVLVLRPKTSALAGVFVAGAVPFRHGRGGGTTLIVGGANFGMQPTVTVGGKSCAVVMSSASEIHCTVPASAGGGLVDVVVADGGGEVGTLQKAVLYMAV